MGLFDEIYIVGKIRCPSCEKRVNYRKEQTRWQTKDLGRLMGLYKIAGCSMYKSVGILPEFKTVWTEEEAEAHNKELEEQYGESKFGRSMLAVWEVKAGDERLLEGAETMEAQNWKSLGELPHQWIEAYTHCENCPDGSVDVYLKFTDGVLVESYEEYNPYDDLAPGITTRYDGHNGLVLPREPE